MSRLYTWYKVKEIGRNVFGFKVERQVYCDTHPNHVALFMLQKKLENYVIFKNDEKVIFPPYFIVNPSELSTPKIDMFQKYIEDWENNPEFENPTGL